MIEKTRDLIASMPKAKQVHKRPMSITGRVAAILSPRDLVMNIGADAGVEVGMIFDVLDEAVVITDPDTSEQLGIIQQKKTIVEVTSVERKFAVARSCYASFRDSTRSNSLFVKVGDTVKLVAEQQG